MKFTRAAMLAAVALVVTACGGGDNGTKPSGPVTFVPVSYVFGTDTVHGTITVDGTALTIARDSIIGLARGSHNLTTQLDAEYLPVSFTETIDPPTSRAEYLVLYAGSCRTYTGDLPYCTNQNVVSWSGSRHIYCRVNDFGDFCTGYVDRDFIGARFPVDSTNAINNSYLSQAKLLIGALMGPEVASAANDTLAMGLYKPGDYGPRSRLKVIPGDSSRWQTQVWTDLRRKPFYLFTTPFLDRDDRPNDNFGLEVRTTYFLPSAEKNVLFIRFDVRNISTDAAYRLVHPEVPVGGLTPHQIYLTPTLDVDVGGPIGAEVIDDNATLFPADSLLVGYDQEFAVGNFGAGTSNRPGLVGLRLLSAPAAAKGLIADLGDSLSYTTPGMERATYRLLAAGRAGTPAAAAGCTDRGSALVCAPETENNVVMGWSVGPIAQLAPGQSTSLTVALVFSYPKTGEFTTLTAVAPHNDQLDQTTTRQIWRIAEPLRTISARIAGTTVDNSP